jgi:hypothetical protein
MTTDAAAIPLHVTLGIPGDESLNLRFPPEYEEEILSLLDEHGIDHNTALEMSAGPAEWIEVVKVLGVVGPAAGLYALATVISKFCHRNDGKELNLKVDGEVTATGYSVKEIERLFKHLPAKQAELDAKTRKVLGTLSADD